MAFSFNPFSGNFDLVKPGLINGRTDTFADLPLASSNAGEIYIVEQSTGVVFVNRQKAGLYISNGTTWEYLTSFTASQVPYDNAASGLVSLDVKGAIDEIALNTTNIGSAYESALLNGTDLELTDIEGNTETVDLSSLLDNTNLARIVSANINASNILELVRDDASIMTVDLSQLDQTTEINSLQTQINANDTEIADLISDLANEVTDRTNADNALQVEIDQNETDIINEATTRQSADNLLQNQIDSNDSEIALNTAKVGITSQQASDILSNNAKLGATGNELESGDNVSELVNDAAYQNNVQVALAVGTLQNTLSDVATSNDYNDLDNLPSIPASAPVDSVNGQIGVVVLDKNDVGLDQVDNTSDINKPVSTATQTALDDKVDNSRVLTDVPVGAVFTDNDTIYDDTAIQAEVDLNTAKVGITPTQASDITANNAKISATGNELEATDLRTVNGESLVGTGDIEISGGGITSDPDPQTNLSATAVLDDLALNTTTGEIEKFDGTNFIQLTNDIGTNQQVAAGSTLGLQQELLANAGQPGLTVLAVGFTNTGRVQGVSLGDGNVVEVFASGADFNTGTVLYREFMSLGEPICFTGLSNGAIIQASQGFYGMSEQVIGTQESPMPLLSYGLSFTSTFFFAFRNSTSLTNPANQGTVRIVNGPLASELTLRFGSGGVVNNQENISLDPWEFTSLQTQGNTEYIIESTNPVMACVHAYTTVSGDGDSRFYDSRLIMPLTNDGITWPRSGNVSAPFNNTQVDFWVRDGAEGRLNSTLGTGVSPGSPVDFDAAIGVGTGANDADYEPNGATRVKAIGLISAYSGADSAGLEASPLMPTSAMSQVVAQPFFIADNGDGGNSGVAIASPYEGTAKVYQWNQTTNQLDLAYTVPLTRNGVTVTTQDDQNHPAAGLVSNDGVASNLLVGSLGPGVVIADVPITVVAQNGDPAEGPANIIRSQNGTTTTGIIEEDDETLMLGITPTTIAVEIREDVNGILRKRVIDASGVETWEIA